MKSEVRQDASALMQEQEGVNDANKAKSMLK